MTPYRYSFFQGRPLIDLSEDSPDEEVPITTSAESNPDQTYPTPSRSPEASNTQAQTDHSEIRPIKPLPRSHLSENSNRAVHSAIRTKVAIALMKEGRDNLDRSRLCYEIGITKQRLSEMIDNDGSLWKAMMAAARSSG